jgi:(2Fe-2S) ferredoxin
MARRLAHYKGFDICDWGPYLLVIEEGDYDWHQVPFFSVDDAKALIDNHHQKRDSKCRN